VTSRESDQNEKPAKSGHFEWFRPSRLLFWGLVLVVLTLLFYAEENWRGYHAWEKYKQTMASRGEPLEPALFIPPPVADEQNFAMTPALAPLFDFVPGTQHWRDSNAPSLFQELSVKYDAAAGLIKERSGARANSWVHPATDLDAWAWAFSQGTNRSHKTSAREPVVATNFSSREAANAVIQGLADFGPVLDELRAASHRPRSRFNIRYDEDNPATILLPHLAKMKHFCQVLQLRASAELALGRIEDAKADLDLLLYLSDTSREEPIIISQLVRMAELQLGLQPLAEGMGKWTEPQLKELQERVHSFDFCADLKRSLQAERVLFGGGVIDYVRRSSHKLRLIDEFTGAMEGGDSNAALPMGLLFTAAPNGWLYLEEVNLSQTFDQYLLPTIDVNNRQISPETVRKSDEAIGNITQGSPGSKVLHHRLFSALLIPAMSRLAEKVAFAQTAVDTASLACALERFRLANGHFPESLNLLSPQFFSQLPKDIINGKPLVYRLMPDGHYLLYSVGWNERDDSGSPQEGKGGKIDPKEGDWVWADNF
jgi:hypothetical protein